VVFISFKYAGDSSKSHLFLKNGGRWGWGPLLAINVKKERGVRSNLAYNNKIK
jgi:hypothetical protein